jgi:signal transduction histidine kinase
MGTHAFEPRLTGTPRPLKTQVYEDIYAIGRESLFNAARYAHASLITLQVDYGRQEFQLTVRDNGRGLGGDKSADGRDGAHWGLQGIAERARLIGADLHVDSAAGRGTTIALRVRKNLAYESESS